MNDIDFIKTASLSQLIDFISEFSEMQIPENILTELNKRGLEFGFKVSNPYWIDTNENVHFNVLVEFINNPAEPEPISIYKQPQGRVPWFMVIAVLLIIIVLSYEK